jgi:outer membrane protein assembly factor BamE (lipoprotein component of BamABCDE complex)
MIVRPGRACFVLAAAGMLAAGCARVPDHQGFVLEPTVINAIQPGTDNKDSVQNSLGRPTFAGTFSDNDWYYISRDTSNMAFNMPKPHAQTILHIRFDPGGNVASVDRRGMEDVASIRPNGDRTPTLGHRRSLFDELFGNIGQVGALGGGSGNGGNTGGGSGPH